MLAHGDNGQKRRQSFLVAIPRHTKLTKECPYSIKWSSSWTRRRSTVWQRTGNRRCSAQDGRHVEPNMYIHCILFGLNLGFFVIILSVFCCKLLRGELSAVNWTLTRETEQTGYNVLFCLLLSRRFKTHNLLISSKVLKIASNYNIAFLAWLCDIFSQKIISHHKTIFNRVKVKE